MSLSCNLWGQCFNAVYNYHNLETLQNDSQAEEYDEEDEIEDEEANGLVADASEAPKVIISLISSIVITDMQIIILWQIPTNALYILQ